MPRAANSSRVIAVGCSAALLGVLVVGWGIHVKTLDQAINEKRANLKKLQVGDRVPPTRDVTDYFITRAEALKRQYESALQQLTVGAAGQFIESQADPQLFFQQRIHDVRGGLERTAKARGMEPPMLLGLPKELPPSDAVPRFLVQLGVMQDMGERVMAIKGITHVVSLKADDPQDVDVIQKGDEAFLMRLPVRVRVQCSLEALATLMALWPGGAPMLDMQEVHVTSAPNVTTLDVECVVARYLVIKPELEPMREEDAAPRKRTRS